MTDLGWALEGNACGSRDGSLLVARAGSSPRPLRLAPRVEGPHVIAVGVYHPREVVGRLYARIEGDEHFTRIDTLRTEASFERVVLGVADLSGRGVELAVFGRPAWIDYVEFAPVREQSSPRGKGELLGIVDFAVDAPSARPAGREAASAVRRHVETGFTMLAWKAYAVRCEYRTRVGAQRQPEEFADGPSVGHLLQSYDTLQQAVEEAKRLAIPILGWARISNEFSKPAPHPFSPTTPFHLAHPDMVQVSREGLKRPRLSFAYAEVRRHKAELLAEIAGYGVDGILVDTLRHPPMAGYESVLIERFMAEGGEDPRLMPGDGSEDWLRFRARHAFTQFLIEARERIDATTGRRVPIYVRVHDQPWSNLVSGCDVPDWIKRGVVDGLIAAPWCPTPDTQPDSIDVRPFADIAQGRARIFGQVWRYGSMAQAGALARQVYGGGGDGVAVYDSEIAVAKPGCREHLWRLAQRGSTD